jgi:hypothetical protein
VTVEEMIKELEKLPGDKAIVLFDYWEDEKGVGSVQPHPHDDKKVMIYP